MLLGQEVPIINYSTDSNGQVLLEVNSTGQNYYVLKVRHHIDSLFELTNSVTMGADNTTIISEALAAFPIEHYQVLEYPISSAADSDGDGIDDITEYQNIPDQSPINAAPELNLYRGRVMVNSFTLFKELSIKKDLVQWSEFLNGKEFVKYLITDFDSNPKIYFVNSNNYNLHIDFANAQGLDIAGDQVKKGQVIFHPASISNNGTLGTFAFNYSNGIPQDFDVVQRTHELLASNMPFLENNLSYFITDNNQAQYNQDSLLFQNSRVPALLESDVYAGIDYWGLNQAEGFGFFRQVALDEIPGSRDIVLYDALPNTLPRVGGIMTSVVQTPLSHVNLRAIQNNIPNAFIRDPLSNDSIANLLNDYIYYKVEQNGFIIRKASLEEVNKWYEDIRPEEEQIPPLNLDYKNILALDDISFSMFDGFGAKCANIATMRTFGFPEGTIPNGHGVPFHFYHEFMKYNDFYDEIESIMTNSAFIADRNTRDDMLNDFRTKIKAAEMPEWMMDELADMHASFPEGTSVRCRSSSNNEDLAGFNGAGLYTSKTQHPHEGHISKSIKQVYASLWNLRAFEERDFYRINHTIAAMAVLCHPNYTDEKVNGVGVSTDPVYNTERTFYLNSQIGEELITNPDSLSVPEEILLYRDLTGANGYVIIQPSNLVPIDSNLMAEPYLNQMRDFLSVIHDRFEPLYDAIGNETYAMDIEYKITSDNQLIIKQARPWVSYREKSDIIMCNDDDLDIRVFPNPASEYITVECDECRLSNIRITNVTGHVYQQEFVPNTNSSTLRIYIGELPFGIYTLNVFSTSQIPCRSVKFIKTN